jgi:isoquinoline 1-oxidoreductase beta subunit
MTKRSDPPSFGLVTAAANAAFSRRQALRGGALLFAFAAVGRRKAWAAGEEPSLRAIAGGDLGIGDAFDGFAPGGFIRIGRDGSIDLIVPNVEMGQGIYTAEAMLLAEELEVGLDQVRVLPAPPNEELYKQPMLQSQTTGGSTSIRGAFIPLRQAGAAARTMLIAAAAARLGVPAEDLAAERGTVLHRASGRSVTYAEVIEDAARQPVPQDPPLKRPEDWRLVGTPAKRVETASKVNGTAVFGIDVRIDGMKVATVMASPVRGGKVKRVDDTAARAVPGVVDVVVIDTAVAVVGDHFWAAKTGLDALVVDWDPGDNAGLDQAQLAAALQTASETGSPILGREEGDTDRAFTSAARTVEATYRLPFLAHATMEPINTTIHVTPEGADIWVGTQVPTAAQAVAAKRLGLPPEKVRLHNQLLGGGFGRRLVADSVEQAAEIAKGLSYPVKIIWTREEDIRQDLYRPAYHDRISAALDAEGRIVGFRDRIAGGSVLGAYLPGGLPEGTIDSDAIEGAAVTPYTFPNLVVDWVRADPPVPVTWWRGVGPTHNVYVVESFMDECDEAAGQDPVAFRLAHLAANPRGAAVLKLAAEKAGWGGDLPAGSGRGVSLHGSFGSHIAVVVEVDATGDEVRMTRVVAAVDCGEVVNPDTVKAQIEGGVLFGLSAALYNDITFKDGRVEQGNFDDYLQLRMEAAPPVEVHLVRNHEDPGGIGETGTVSAAPALGNAIAAATGKRLRTLPFTAGGAA